MSVTHSLQTWDILKEFGFQPDASVWSDIQPGLSFDFGNFKLSASAVMNMRFAEVVMFTGVLATPRTIAEVQFEMPRGIESREKTAAWLTWNLDKYADRVFTPAVPVPWLELGRANHRLLPWYFDREAYEARPHCLLERDWARPLLKKLRATISSTPEESVVWFSFDGEVLKICCGEAVMAAAAHGERWPARFGLKAAQLKDLPNRLMQPIVEFSEWEKRFHIANWRYDDVTAEPHNA